MALSCCQSDEIPRESNLSEKEFHDEYFLKARPDQHLFSLFSGLFPDPSWHHSPSVTSDQPLHPGPETSEVTRAGAGVSSSLSGAWSHQSSQSSISGGHGVNIIPVSSNIHQAIWCGQHWIIFFVFEFLSTFKNMSDSELFPELGALQWFSIRRHVNNGAAAEVSRGGGGGRPGFVK